MNCYLTHFYKKHVACYIIRPLIFGVCSQLALVFGSVDLLYSKMSFICHLLTFTDTSSISQHTLKPLIFSVQYPSKCISLPHARTFCIWCRRRRTLVTDRVKISYWKNQLYKLGPNLGMFISFMVSPQESISVLQRRFLDRDHHYSDEISLCNTPLILK